MKVPRLRPVIKRKNLPRGIRLLPLEEGQPRPNGVQWTIAGKRTSAFFDSIEKLEGKVDELIAARKDGTLSLMPSPSEVAEWRSFKAFVGTTTIHDVVAGWKSWTELHAVKK